MDSGGTSTDLEIGRGFRRRNRYRIPHDDPRTLAVGGNKNSVLTVMRTLSQVCIAGNLLVLTTVSLMAYRALSIDIPLNLDLQAGDVVSKITLLIQPVLNSTLGTVQDILTP
jgi:hypothetical protein